MGRSELDLAAEAIGARAPTPVSRSRAIDGFVSYHIEQVAEVDLVTTLGLPDLRFMARTPSGGGGAASILGSGRARGRERNRRVRRRVPRPQPLQGRVVRRQSESGRPPWAKAGRRLRDSRQWQHPFGVAAPAHELALIARRHMHVYGTRAEHFGMQAVAQRFHASRNPDAIMRERDHARRLGGVASDRGADPAVRLLTRERRRGRGARHVARTGARSAQPAVPVLAQVQYGAPIHTELADFFATTAAFGERDGGAVTAGRRLFGAAGVTPADVDVAMIVEPFTVAVPLALEQYGFCAMGDGGPFIESGATRWPDGALPVNTHGGSNGEAFIHGVNHLPEAVRQLRGTVCNQVAGAEIAFVCGAISDPSGAVLLGVDR